VRDIYSKNLSALPFFCPPSFAKPTAQRSPRLRPLQTANHSEDFFLEPLLFVLPEESEVDVVLDSGFELDVSDLLDAEESEDDFDSPLEPSLEDLLSAAADFL
jgi:hypothetical protein